MRTVVNKKAWKEYVRLVKLAGGIPYGECELVALMIHRVLPTSSVVKGNVLIEIEPSGREFVEHFWVQHQGHDIDPLSQDWRAIVVSRSAIEVVEASRILEDYLLLLEEFPEPLENTMFPLRWKLKGEIFQTHNDSDLHLPEPLRQIEHNWDYEEKGNPFLF